jgi:MFS family permease
MQKTAQVWLVLELTGSGTLLGVTAALQQLPTLIFGAWGGLLADRIDKRKLLLWMQSIACALALLLGILVGTDRIELWMVLVLAFALGTTDSVEKPARHTFIVEMVGSSHLMNAMTLNHVLMNAGKVVGPAIAGVLIARIGLSWCFLLNALSYFAVLVGLLLMRKHELEPVIPANRAAGQLREGFRYVRRTPELLGLLVLMTVSGMLAYEWTVSLPLLAREAFNGDAQTFALLLSSMGLGAVVGGLVVASTLQASTRTLMIAGFVFSFFVLVTALAPTLAIAVVGATILGGASIAFRSVASSLVQVYSAPDMRGRVMALLLMATGGTTTVGAPLVGWFSEVFGSRIALGQGGVATALACGATLLYLRRRGNVKTSDLVVPGAAAR